MPTPRTVVRPFLPSDAAACLELFRDTVHRVNSGDYSSAQIHAWAPLNVKVPGWMERFENRIAYVAVAGSSLTGFADMTIEGHLDRLFVSADHQRQGIAGRLLTHLLNDDRRPRGSNITTEASITAKPFFESIGFTVVKRQTVLCRGVELTNFKMLLERSTTD